MDFTLTENPSEELIRLSKEILFELEGYVEECKAKDYKTGE